MLVAHQPLAHVGELSFAAVVEAFVEHLGDAELKHGVAEELQPLVVIAAVLVSVAAVGQGLDNVGVVAQVVAPWIQPPPSTSWPA